MLTRRSLAALTLALFALRPGSAQDTAIPQALERAIPRLLEQGSIPGLSIALIESGEIRWSGTFGVRSLASSEPVDAQTVFEAASLSKPVFAYVVLRMVERGDFDLDKPLAEILPYERLEHEDRYRQITARMVMSHSSGLPNWGGDRLELEFDPGTAFNYSGEGFVYLQKTVEKLTGLTLDQVARREVFAPLGMERSSYVWQEAFQADIAARHDSQGEVSPIGHSNEANAAASLLTTAQDYARFLNAIVKSQGLKPPTAAAMLQPERSLESATWGASEEAKQHLSWGLGWGLQATQRERAFWHWGDNGDAKAFTMVDVDTGSGFVYFANSSDGLSIAGAIVELVFGEPSWALGWLDYERHDDPARIARLTLIRSHDEGGVEGLTTALQRLRASQPDLMTEGLVDKLGHQLLERKNVEAALAVFRFNVQTSSESASAHESLGEAYLTAGSYDSALQSYRKSLALDSDDETVERALRWIEQRLEAESRPVEVPLDTLRRYAGDYGPRHVVLEGDTLYYQREGNSRYRLVPISQDLFALQDMETFRVRFARDDDGQIVKIVGLYLGGNQDETPRSP